MACLKDTRPPKVDFFCHLGHFAHVLAEIVSIRLKILNNKNLIGRVKNLFINVLGNMF